MSELLSLFVFGALGLAFLAVKIAQPRGDGGPVLLGGSVAAGDESHD